MKGLFQRDEVKQYWDLMSEKELARYPKACFYCAILFFVGILIITRFRFDFIRFLLILAFVILGTRVPKITLYWRFLKQGNEVIKAIPLWVNTIYALIGENNIYNAIKISYEQAPKSIKKELFEFIKKIEFEQDNRKLYTQFLNRYHIDGFENIMMKIFEFRNLAKDKLKYEIVSLNDELSGIEKLKRQQRMKSEMFLVDIVTTVMIAIPCLYMFFSSMILTEILL